MFRVLPAYEVFKFKEVWDICLNLIDFSKKNHFVYTQNWI